MQLLNADKWKILWIFAPVFMAGDVWGKNDQKFNVLLLVSDDMRPQLGAYLGPDYPSPVHPKMHTPNLDALANQSFLMKRAFVQQAYCSPSRTSLLTGRRPDTTHVYDLGHYFRKVGGNFTTLPEYFKNNGYLSIGMGKVFHPGEAASGNDDPISWSGVEPYFHAPNLDYWDSQHGVSWRAVTREERDKHPLPDQQTADHAVETLRRVAPKAKTGEQPFFIAVGFHKPHLPYVFPEEFLKLYPEIRFPPNPYAPVNMPSVAWYDYFGLRQFSDIKKLNASGAINTTLPDKVVLDLRRAYYCALSYADYLFGQVLSELDALGLSESTIVTFWGDHGYHLGEHGEWCKENNFELATHAPMMLKIPGITDKGMVTEQLTEFVDLFPTLVEAAGLPLLDLCPLNSTKVELCREGQSLMPLIKALRNSSADGIRSTPEWKDRVFSQYPRYLNGTNIMGYTMRTQRYRYTEWVRFLYATHQPIWNDVYGIELYDHGVDPAENVNVYDEPPYKYIREDSSAKLHAGWRDVIV